MALSVRYTYNVKLDELEVPTKLDKLEAPCKGYFGPYSGARPGALRGRQG